MTGTRLDDLGDHARDLARRSMTWLDGCWDEAAGLIRRPPDPGVSGDTVHIVRSTAWYALGLLLRDANGDRARAFGAIGTVLDHQYDAAAMPHHGTFRRSPDDPAPPEAPKVWRDYDPNWREFVGTTLALVLIEYEARLPPDLVASIDEGLRRAMAGTLARPVRASYTNIALMSAFLRGFAADRFDEPAWAVDAERLAGETFSRFRENSTFDEYNSPTYYGVNLYALALWRSYGSESLRAAGAEMEAALWRDIARFYHAEMRNLVGPYDRSYGMDMRRYLALVGLPFWLAVGRAKAPVPDVGQPFAHAWDFGFAPLVALLGARVPHDALEHLLEFRGERQIEQLIVADPRRIATAWVGERLMIGAQASGGRMRAKEQFHAATIHWLTPDGDVGWIRLRHERPVDARAERNRLVVESAVDEPQEFIFEVCVPEIERSAVQSDHWELPGLSVYVRADATGFTVQPGDGFIEVRYPATRCDLHLRNEGRSAGPLRRP